MLTIAYITGRPNPRWEWFIDSLANQTTQAQRANIQLVFVDGHLWRKSPTIERFGAIDFGNSDWHDAERRSALDCDIAGRFKYLHIPPKPCAYQGPFRQTNRDLFSAGNARNSALVVAQGNFVMFVDDLSVLSPIWFAQVVHAAEHGYVTCGAYAKQRKLVVVNGTIQSFEDYPQGRDSRWDRGSSDGIVPIGGGGLFGCSFGVPLEAALEVDGNDRATDGQGGEDCELGIRLERAGWALFYNRNLFTTESEELHHDGSKLPQERRLVLRDRLPAAYDSYKLIREDEKYWSDHVMLNRLANETDRILPIIGDNLRQLRSQFFATGMVPIPEPNMRDWRDGVLLSEL